MEEMRSNRLRLWKDPLFWVAFSCAGFIIALTLWFGIGVDNSVFGYCSWVWQHYGLPPYVGCMECDYPGIFLITRFAMLFGENALSLRVLDVCAQLSVLVMIFYLAKRLSGLGMSGLLACLFYATYYYSLDFQMTAQREAFILWLSLIATVVSLVMKRRVFARAVLAGLLLGFIFLLKPTYGLFWPLFGLWFLLEGFGKGLGILAAELGVFSLCCLAPAGVIILLYWHWGYLPDLFALTIDYTFHVYVKLPIFAEKSGVLYTTDNIRVIPYLLKQFLGFYVPALTGAVIFFARVPVFRDPKQKKLLRVIVGLIVLSLVSAYLQLGVYLYHHIVIWGYLMILCGCGWAGALKLIKGANSSFPRQAVCWALLAMVLALMFLHVPGYLRSFAVNYSFRSLDRAYETQYSLPMETARYLQTVMRPSDQVYYFGNISMIPFLLKKKLGAPFPFTIQLHLRTADGDLKTEQLNWKKRYIDGFLELKPRFFIFDANCLFCPGGDLRGVLKGDFPGLQAALDKNYHLAKSFGAVEIYEMN